MKAVVFEKFGGSKELYFKEMPTPEPAEDEVQIQLSHAAVNPVDWKIREGFFGNAMPHDFPIIPGWDGAGIVSKIGKNVTHFSIGDEVFAYFRKPLVKWGTYAEYVCMPEKFVAPKPKSLFLEQAASLPLVSLTAWQALFDFADLKPGEKLLVHAGAGGVGGMAVQFGSWKGAYVVATASKKNHEYVCSLGAQKMLDYTQETWVQEAKALAGTGFDVILDCAGGETLQKSIGLLEKRGRLISIVDRDVEKYTTSDIRAGFVFVAPHREQLMQIALLIEEKKVVLPHIQILPLEKASYAQDLLQERHCRGKIVLEISAYR